MILQIQSFWNNKERSMTIIFLDVDGVLNCDADFRDVFRDKDASEMYERLPEDPMNAIISREKLQQLATLVSTLDKEVQVVVSSTWRETERHLDLLTRALKSCGISVYGVTRDTDKNEPRGHEILDYLVELVVDGHVEVPDNILILDDGNDMSPLGRYLVQTSWMGGLCDKHIRKAVALHKQGLLKIDREMIMKLHKDTVEIKEN
jgi:hypothetical protein